MGAGVGGHECWSAPAQIRRARRPKLSGWRTRELPMAGRRIEFSHSSPAARSCSRSAPRRAKRSRRPSRNVDGVTAIDAAALVDLCLRC